MPAGRHLFSSVMLTHGPPSLGSGHTGHCLVSQTEVLTASGPLHMLFPLLECLSWIFGHKRLLTMWRLCVASGCLSSQTISPIRAEVLPASFPGHPQSPAPHGR